MWRSLAWMPMALGVFASTEARAATLYWDGGTTNITTNGDGVSQGGSGTWNNSITNWDRGAGLSHVTSTTADSVVFGGVAGTVTLGSNRTVVGVTFATDGYTLGGTRTLKPGAGGITVNGSATINALLSLNANQSWTVAAGKTLTVGGTITNGGFTLTIAGAGDTAISGVISGTGGLIKSGTGTLTLTGANTYTGTTTLAGGVVALGVAQNGTTSGPLGRATTAGSLLFTGGTLRYSAVNNADYSSRFSTGGGQTWRIDTNGVAVTYAAALAGASSLIKLGAGTLTLTGASTYSAGTTVSAGTLALGNLTNTLADSGAVTVDGATAVLSLGANSDTVGVVTLRNGGAITGTTGVLSASAYEVESGSVSAQLGGVGALTKTTAGTVTLSGANTYAGGTTVSAGTLVVTGSLSDTGAVTVSGGTYTAGASDTIGALTLLSGTIDGTGTVAASSYTVESGAILAKLTGGAAALVKNTGGTVTLAGANTYGGATTVNAGTLAVTGSIDAASAVSVASGATLSGTGNVAGTVTVASGGIITAGDGASGRLTVGNLTFSGAGTVNIGSLANYTALSALNVTGALTTTGTVTLSLTAEVLANGSYHLISHGNALADLSGFVVSGATLGGRQVGILTNNAGVIDYVVTGDSSPKWTGAVNGVWDTTTANWKLIADGRVTTFQAGDNLLFDDSATGTTTLTLASGVNPVAVTVANVTRQYTFSGAGGITTGTLVKSGAGTLTIINANTYAGGTTLNAGVLQLGNDGALGTGAIHAHGGVLSSDSVNARTLTNALTLAGDLTLGDAVRSGALTFTGAVDLGGAVRTLTTASTVTLAGVVSGGGLLKTGSGTLVLSGANTYAGGTALAAGVLALNTDAALGSGSLAITGPSTLRFDAPLSFTHDTALTAGVTASLDVNGFAVTHAGVVSGGGSLRKTGAGTLTLSGANTYTGSTTVAAGVLALSGGAALADASDVVLANAAGATLRLNAHETIGTLSGGGALGGLVDLQAYTLTVGGATDSAYAGVITGAGALTKSGAGVLTLTGANTYGGATTIAGGTLAIAADAGLGSAPASATPGALVLSGGTLATTASFSLATNRGVTTGGTLDVSAGTTLTYGGIAAGAGDLIKSGSGALVLTGANTYTGATRVNAGTLMVQGALASGSTVSVAGGATLAGAGIVAGSVLADDGANLTAGTGVSGSLRIGGNLTFVGDGVINIGAPAGYTGSAAIQVAGSLTPQNTGATIVLNLASGSLSAGTYHLLSHTNVLSAGEFGVFSVTGPTVGLRQTASLVNAAGVIDYVVAGANPYWTGAVSTAWDTTSLNWRLIGTSTDTRFLAADDVALFDDAAAGTGAVSVTLAAGVLPAITTFNNAGRDYTLSGAGGITSGALIKSGAGTLTLRTVNTYNGGTTLNAGVLRLGNSGALGSGLVTLNGGTLSSDSGTPVTLGNALALGGDITLGHATDNGLLTLTGAVNLGGAVRRITAASNVVASGVLSNGGLTLAGTGMLTLTANNTYSGATTVESGATLRLGDGVTDGSLDVSSPIVVQGAMVYNMVGNRTYSHVITGAGALIKSGAGTLTLTGQNTFTGTVSIAGGMLRLGDGVSDGSLSGASGIVNNGALVHNLVGDGTYANVISGSGTLTKSGAGMLTLTGANTYAGVTTITDGTLRLGDGATDGSLANSSAIANNGVLIYHLVGAQTVSQVISGAGTLTKSGGGTLTLTGLNTYNGVTTIAAGTLRIGDGVTDGSIVGSSAIVNHGTLEYAVAGTRLYDKLISGTGALIKSGAGTLILTRANTYAGVTTIAAGTLKLGDGITDGALGTGASVVNNGALVFDLVGDYDCTHAISGTGSVLKTGAGTLTLRGANTFGGGMTLAGGTVAVENVGNLGDLAVALTFASDSTLKSLADRTVTRGWTIGNGVTATIDTNGYNVVFSGPVVGAGGALTKTGAGTLTVANNLSTYTGLTTISGGTLRIGNGTINGNLDGSSGILNNAALVLDAAPATTPTYAKVISGTGTLEKQGTGTFTLTGASTYSGATTVTAGLLRLGDGVTNGSLLGTSGITLASGTTLAYDVVGASTADRPIGGDGGVTKAGTGALTLSGANTHAGATVVTAGTLRLGSDTALGSAAAGTTVDAGATLDLNGRTVGAEALNLAGTGVGDAGALVNQGGGAANFAGPITLTADARVGGAGNLTLSGAIGGGAHALTKVGAGILTLTGASTYSGATTLAAGTLVVDGSLDAGSAVAVASGATLAGSGTIGGSVTVASGGIVTAGDGSTGTLTIGGNLHFSGVGTVNLGMLSTTAAPIVVTGALTLGGGAGAVTLAVHPGVLANGTYHLLSQADTGLSVSGLSITGQDFGGVTSRRAGVLANNGGMIDLVVTGNNPVWTGNAGGAWDTTTDNNWKLLIGGAETRFLTDDVVLFNDSATVTTVDIAAGVATTAVNFDIATKHYTLQGVAGITAGALTKMGAGTLTITNANTYAGGTVLHEGWLQVGNNAALGSGLLAFHAGKFSSDSAAARTLANTVSVAGDVILGDSVNTGAINFSSTNLVDLGGGTRRITTLVDVTLSNFINGSYIKDGAGTLTLTQSTTSPLDITIHAGTLSIGAVSVGAASSTLIFSGDGTLRVTADVDAGGNRNFVINPGVTATVETGYNVRNGGVIAGAGSLMKTGAGTLTLTGENTYTGHTTVSAGTLSIGDGVTDGSLAAGSGVTTNATLVFNLAGDRTYAKVIDGTGSLIKSGAGTLTLTGANTYAGGTTVTAGSLKIGDGITDGALGAGAVNLATGAVLRLDLSGNGTYAQVISGDGGVIKSGAGTLTLTGFNTFGGGMTLAGGTVAVENAQNLGALGVALTFAADSTLKSLADRTVARGWNIDGGVTATVDTNGYTVDITGALSGAGSLTKVGGGRLSLLNGASTYSGITTVREGTLAISADGDLGAVPGVATIGKLRLDGGTLAATGIFDIHANRGIQLLRTSTFEVAAGAEVVYAGVLAGTGGFIKTGAGTLELYGRNTFDGIIRLREGAIEINDALSLGNSVGGDLIFEGSGTLKVTEIPVPVFENRIYTLNTGVLATIDTHGNALTHSGVINGDGALIKTGAGTLTLTGTDEHTGATTIVAGTLRLDRAAADNATVSASDITLAGGALRLGRSEQIADTRSVTLNDGAFEFDGAGLTETLGTLTLSGGTLNTGANTLSALALNLTGGVHTVAQGGVLVVRSGAAGGIVFGGAANPALLLESSASTPGTLVLANDVTVDATLTSGAARILTTGSGIRSGVVDLAGGVRTFSIHDGASAADMEIAASVTNGGLVKTGAGTLMLTGNNLYAGGTTIAAGTLEIGGGSLGAGTYAGAVANAGTLKFSTSADQILSGVMSGAGALIKTGSGALTLSGANTHSGLTTVSAGVLMAASESAFGSGALRVSGGALASAVANANVGSLTVDHSASAVSLNDTAAGSVTVAGDVAVSAGTLHFDIPGVAEFDRVVGSGGHFTITGGVISLTGFTGFEGAGAAGNSYALISGFASSGNTVSGLSITGYDTANWSAALTADGVLAFTAIPEPSTWGLLGAGALAAVACVRRRRRLEGAVR